MPQRPQLRASSRLRLQLVSCSNQKFLGGMSVTQPVHRTTGSQWQFQDVAPKTYVHWSPLVDYFHGHNEYPFRSMILQSIRIDGSGRPAYDVEAMAEYAEEEG
jgi:hypothetical protein